MFKEKLTGEVDNNGAKNVKIMVSLKHLSNFWKTLDMSLINCEMNLVLIWSKKFFLVSGTATIQVPMFVISDTKLYVPAVTLSTRG